ncbi:MAG: tetraacyldisaccharide 4'-kinase [Flavobacteriaceae bacterium]|nr:tetraacyldisaccharide 4'-kinase [Flavobacteriaceae bacterium]
MAFLRKLLFPFAVLYGAIMRLRNYFYDKGWLKSMSFDIPIIAVGNLSVGGTGKTPMIEYLIEILKDDYQLAVLSRGYGRKTKGYRTVEVDSLAIDVGDEPLQLKQKYPAVEVAVCEARKNGIPKLQKRSEVILLDDAFQHRSVKASRYILLTAFDDLFINDHILPMGNLRESRKGAKRADLIVVTKCPPKVPYATLQKIEFVMPIQEYQKIYFSSIGYDDRIYGVSESQPLSYLKDKPFLLVTGIAKSAPLVAHLRSMGLDFEHQNYKDHHNFTSEDINRLKKEELILTTEKDYVRLYPKLEKFAMYYLPIKTKILKDQELFFEETIRQMIRRAR